MTFSPNMRLLKYREASPLYYPRYKPLVLHCSVHQNPLEDLIKQRFLGPTYRVSDTIGVDWPDHLISIKIPGDANAIHSVTTL